VFLSRALGEDSVESKSADGSVNIVVLQADGRQFGLVVDGVNDTEEIVVKPLGKELKGLPMYAGATIMGDGRVALILDVLGIAQRANVVSGVRDRGLVKSETSVNAAADEARALLLFQVRDGGFMALPLSMVSRLEEFPAAARERSGDQEVVQYRGEILPLLDLRAVFGHGGDDGAGPLQVVVYSERGRSVGLVVDRIVDIVTAAYAVKHRSRRHGLLGAATIQGRVTDLLDVHALIPEVDPSFFQDGPPA
jgi:two-component system chemotaxis sensor kinase CheA